MVEFDRPKQPVSKATLTVSVQAVFFGPDPVLRVWLLDPPVNREPVRHGIAAGATRDAGLSAHPSIIGVHRILDGTQPLTDVYVTGLGPITGVVDAQNTNIGTVTGAASGGALVATLSRAGVFGSRVGAGSVTTATVTVTASGGTGPYTYAWANVSGDTFTVTAPTGATTAFSTTVTVGEDKSGIYRCTVTDSAMATYTVDVAASVAEIS
jgi:hypothetical protein